MNLKDLRTLHTLADAKYRARRQIFQGLVQKENAIRAELSRLDEQAKSANSSSDPQMQSIGADVIWKAWLGKAKTSLNMKLALVLAEKDQHIRQVRQAYGKVLTARELMDTASHEERKKHSEKDLERAIEMSLFSDHPPTHQK